MNITRRTAYPDIVSSLKINKYDDFISYIFKDPNNTWKYMNHEDLEYLYNTKRLTINRYIDESENIYHILFDNVDILTDIYKLVRTMKIINKYFDDDINHVFKNKTPLLCLLYNIKDLLFYKKAYDLGNIYYLLDNIIECGANITEEILLYSKILDRHYKTNISDYLVSISCQNIKDPGYD